MQKLLRRVSIRQPIYFKAVLSKNQTTIYPPNPKQNYLCERQQRKQERFCDRNVTNSPPISGWKKCGRRREWAIMLGSIKSLSHLSEIWMQNDSSLNY